MTLYSIFNVRSRETVCIYILDSVMRIELFKAVNGPKFDKYCGAIDHLPLVT